MAYRRRPDVCGCRKRVSPRSQMQLNILYGLVVAFFLLPVFFFRVCCLCLNYTRHMVQGFGMIVFRKHLGSYVYVTGKIYPPKSPVRLAAPGGS